MGLLGLLVIAGQIPEADAHIRDQVVDQMDGGGQHGVVAGHRQRIVELHVVHIIGGILVQMRHRHVERGHVLLGGALAGQTHDAHLNHPAELVKGLCAAHFVGALDPGARLLDVIRVPQQHLSVAAPVDGTQEFQNRQTLPQRAAPDAQHLGQIALRGQILPYPDVTVLNGLDQSLHNKLRHPRCGVLLYFFNMHGDYSLSFLFCRKGASQVLTAILHGVFS